MLTFVGLSGLILYLAAWFLLPAEDADQSIAADWFNLDKNEEQVRIIGLVVAAVLAALAIVGDSQWAWWGLPWVLVPLAVLYWLFVVRPRRRASRRPRRRPARAIAVEPRTPRTPPCCRPAATPSPTPAAQASREQEAGLLRR